MGRVFFNTRKNIVSLTADYSALASDSGTTFMLNAAAGLTVTLPAVADALDGWNAVFVVATVTTFTPNPFSSLGAICSKPALANTV